MRPIDADALIDNMVDYVADGYAISHTDFESYTKMVQTAPTIEAVSVVRCKECMFSKVYQNDSSGVMGRFCEAFTQVRMVSDDDFCSYGERKESE